MNDYNPDDANRDNVNSPDEDLPLSNKDKLRPEQERDWVPEEAIAALRMERTVMDPLGSYEDQARQLFRENAPNAAASIVHLAVHSINERTRLSAAQYVVDRILGKVGDDTFGAEKNPAQALLEGLVRDAEQHANTSPGPNTSKEE